MGKGPKNLFNMDFLSRYVDNVLSVTPVIDCVLVLQKVPSELHPKVSNHGEGPY